VHRYAVQLSVKPCVSNIKSHILTLGGHVKNWRHIVHRSVDAQLCQICSNMIVSDGTA